MTIKDTTCKIKYLKNETCVIFCCVPTLSIQLIKCFQQCSKQRNTQVYLRQWCGAATLTGLVSSLLSNSTPTDLIHSTFHLNRCRLEWHHLRTFIRLHTAPTGDTKGFIKPFPHVQLNLGFLLSWSLWHISEIKCSTRVWACETPEWFKSICNQWVKIIWKQVPGLTLLPSWIRNSQ